MRVGEERTVDCEEVSVGGGDEGGTVDCGGVRVGEGGTVDCGEVSVGGGGEGGTVHC